MKINEKNYFFSIAIDEAHKAAKKDEVPVGAVIVSPAGDILAKTHNTKEEKQQACNHAEVLAIKEASEKIGAWRLLDCDLYVTLEPCTMCMGAIQQARLKNVYFGAYDPKAGAISLGFNIHKDPRLNHKVNVYGGFKHLECSKIVSDFFRAKRKKYKS